MRTHNKAWTAGLTLAAACLCFIEPAGAGTQETRDFNFAVMGCAHMGVCEARDYALAVAKMRSQKPDFAIFLGGMVDTPRGGNVEALWKEFDSITARLGAPVYDVPGSCNWGPLSVDKDRTDRAKKCFSERNKKNFYSFEHGNSLFIGLDSGAAGGPAADEAQPLPAEQIEFLRKTLKNSQKFDNIFIFMHDSGWMRKNAMTWSAGISPAALIKIKYVFSAKEHYFNADHSDGFTYLVTGSPPCALRRSSHPVFFHFLMVTVNGNTVSVNAVPLKNIPMENMLGGKGRKGDRSTREKTGETEEKDGRRYQLNEPVMMDSIERKAMLPNERIIKELDIRPGMQIADIGAGVGIFTFPMAAAMNGSGMVYATDTDPKMIRALERETALKKIINVSPRSVSAEGVDTFYKSRTFDRMLFVEIYHYLWDPVAYFRELRPSLAKDTGRLFIIAFKQLPDFTELEFEDFDAILMALKSWETSTLFPKIAAGVEDFVRTWRGGEPPAEVKAQLVRNFNAALGDPGLFRDMLTLPPEPEDKDSPERGKALLKMMNPRNLEVSRWLMVELDNEGVFDKKAEQLTDAEKKYLRKLNRTMLTSAFRTEKLDYLKSAYPLYSEKEHIIRQMQAAGYSFVREHDFLNYHYMLEFKQP